VIFADSHPVSGGLTFTIGDPGVLGTRFGTVWPLRRPGGRARRRRRLGGRGHGGAFRTEDGPKDETELHGETITDGVSEVIWTAEEEPLPDGRADVFGLQVRMPNAPDEPIYFPAIQECEQGETGWIQVPSEGEDGAELDEPASAVTLPAAEESDHRGSSTEEPGGSDHEAAASAASDDGSDDDAPMGLAVLGVVLGGLGLLAGWAGLMRSRRDG